MKIVLEIAGETFEVDIERDGNGLRLESEGSKAAAIAEAPGTLRVGDRTHRVEFDGDAVAVVDGKRVPFLFASFAPGPGALGVAAGARVPVRAMMPGRIVRIDAKPGATVRRGDPLLVLEAMKMQNEVLSPSDGVLSQVDVKEGDVVEVGRAMLHIEPAARKG